MGQYHICIWPGYATSNFEFDSLWCSEWNCKAGACFRAHADRHLEHKSNASHQNPTDFKGAVHMAVQRLLHVAQQRQSKSEQHANEDLCQALPFPFKCMHSTWKCSIWQNTNLVYQLNISMVQYIVFVRYTMWNCIGSKPGATSVIPVIPMGFCTQRGSSPKCTCRAKWAFHSSPYLIRMN